MKIALVGGEGFIGSAVRKELDSAKLKYLNFSRNGNQLLEQTKLNPAIQTVTHIIWCASSVNPISAEKNPDLVIKELSNWQYLTDLIARSSSQPIKVIYLSSGGCVYSTSSQGLIESDAANGINAYGIMKVQMEKILQESGLQNIILRVANAYGPNQPTGKGQGVIGEWIHCVKNNKPIQVFGPLNSYRDYINTNDIASAVLNSLHSSDQGIFNIGSGVSTSLSELITFFENITGVRVQTSISTLRVSDRLGYSLDITKSIEALGWRPLTPLAEGIRHAIYS